MNQEPVIIGFKIGQLKFKFKKNRRIKSVFKFKSLIAKVLYCQQITIIHDDNFRCSFNKHQIYLMI